MLGKTPPRIAPGGPVAFQPSLCSRASLHPVCYLRDTAKTVAKHYMNGLPPAAVEAVQGKMAEGMGISERAALNQDKVTRILNSA